MRYSVGYQIDEKRLLVPEIIDNKSKINEVYFAFGDFANGRHRLTTDKNLSWIEAQQRQLEDLNQLYTAGIALNLLLNGNCYGADSLSRSFFCRMGDTIEFLIQKYNLSAVTTTSPVIAKFIRKNFDKLEIRLSVNMEVGEPKSLSMLYDLFDSFYLKREYNRNLKAINRARKWCDENGKKMYMLANSGCINYCPVRNYHDNLVAHEDEIMSRDNAFIFQSLCSEYLKLRENRISIIRDSNFVRPEDIALYEDLFDGAKLATRVNRNPVQIIRAYINEKYIGNIVELLEPDHTSVINPYIIENSMISDDFARHVMECNKDCTNCTFCEKVYYNALQKIDEGVYIYAEQQND